LLVSAIDHRLRYAVLIAARTLQGLVRITNCVGLVLRVDEIDPFPLAPIPVSRKNALDGGRLSRERDVVWCHFWRHHAHQVVDANELVERSDEWVTDVARSVDLHVIEVEKKHEHPGARVFSHGSRLAHRVWLDTSVLRSRATNDHSLEL